MIDPRKAALLSSIGCAAGLGGAPGQNLLPGERSRKIRFVPRQYQS
jgi:hypothetical protein